MQTKIIDISQIHLAAEAILKGDLVAFPTETVYGLGASIWNPLALSKIFSVKNRPSDNPLIVHVGSIEEAISLMEEVPHSFHLLASHFWPGPLSLIVKKNPFISPFVSGGHATIAIRIPAHPVAKKLLELTKVPLAAPSANISGRPSPTRAKDVQEDLEGKIQWILDGGPCAVGIESTVLNLVGDQPILMRPGSVSIEELENILKIPVDSFNHRGPCVSPGMKYRHYAPKASIRLVYQEEEANGEYVISCCGKGIAFSQSTFYQELREADRRGVSEITIYCDPIIRRNEALMNRIVRAAGLETLTGCF